MELNAEPRTQLGKSVKILRKQGFLPAVLYGEGIETKPISVPYSRFEKVYKEAGESSLVTLVMENAPYNVLIHDVAFDPLKGAPIHADFFAVRMDKEIRTMVSLAFKGESPAVKNEAGILVKVVQELEVEALPQNLPHELPVNLAGLAELKSRILVKDLAIPAGVKVLADPEEVIVLVEAQKSEDELKQELETGAAEVIAVKTEQETKRAARAEAKEGDEKAAESAERNSVAESRIYPTILQK
ncbi:MAG: large subunit ribosomal protein L25 [Parcubacteria group bacterium Gr01-1014_33]|nr:MAG: large subunit ribosomal protein L25 [Parcubacteria group bacterium Gr01-1014_33]